MVQSVAVPVPNAAPNHIMLGVDDRSKPRKIRVLENIPQHVPKFYLRAEKGEVGKDYYGDKADLEDYLGSKTFNLLGKYANHQTVGATTALKNANSIVVQRVAGESARRAGVMLYVNVVKKTGANAVSAMGDNGEYIPPEQNDTSSDYYEVVWSKEELNAIPDVVPAFDDAAVEAGTSEPVPGIFLPAKDPGEYGNNLGNRMYGNVDEGFDPRMIGVQKTLPFFAGLVSRPDSITTGKLIPNVNSIKVNPVSWNPVAMDTTTNTSMYIEDVYNDSYHNDGTNGLPPEESPIGKVKVFQENIDAILEFLYGKEKAALLSEETGITGPDPIGTGIGTTLPTPVEADIGKYFIITEEDGNNPAGTYYARLLEGRFVLAAETDVADYTTNNPGANAVAGNVPDTTPPPSFPPLGASKKDYWVVNDDAGNVAEIWTVKRETIVKMILDNSSISQDQFVYDHSNDPDLGTSFMENYVDSYIDEEIVKNSADEGKYLINILSARYSSGKRYAAISVDTNDVIGHTVSNWMGMGKDDFTDMSGNKYTPAQLVASYERAIKADLQRYTDKNDIYQNLALNYARDFWDTGFTMDLKLEMGKVLSRSKVNYPRLSTHTDGQPALTMAQEKAAVARLTASLRGYVESSYFGTPTLRGAVICHSGHLINHPYRKRIAATIDVLDKWSKYCGAENGKWAIGESPEGDPGNIMEMTNLNIEHIGQDDRTTLWGLGGNYMSNTDHSRFSWGAYRSVYDDDTSVLGSQVLAQAIGTLEICLDQAQRKFSGRTDLTDAEVEKQVTDYLQERVDHYGFDSRYRITPHVTVEGVDKLRRFSWTAFFRIAGSVGKTVQTSFIEAYNIDDLQEEA